MRLSFIHIGLFVLLGWCLQHPPMAHADTSCEQTTYHKSSSDCADNSDEPYLTKTFELDEPGKIHVSVPVGNIEVIGSEQSNIVKVELYVKRGYRLWSSSTSIDNYYIHINKEGSEISAIIEPRQHSGQPIGSDDIRFSFVIYVPKQMSTQLYSRSGNISLTNLTGTQFSKSGVGNIKLNNTDGSTKAFTAAGNIVVNGSDGDIKCMTKGGNMEIHNSTGDFRVQSNAGNINAENISGSLLAKTNVGNISASFSSIEKGVKLETNIGNVTTSVEQGTGLDLVLEGSKVSIEQAGQFSGNKSQRSATGTINGGGTVLNMMTDMGNVVLNVHTSSGN